MLKGAPTDFWGKLEHDESGQVTSWHPLVDHCADVAACAEALLELPTWRGRLARLCGRDDLDETLRARLSVFSALHDLGKFNIGFQAKGRKELGPTRGHVREALTAIGRDVFSSVDQLGEWGDGACGLLASAMCHHGRPYALKHATNFEPVVWEQRGNLTPSSGVEELLDRCRVWFPLAFRPDQRDLPDDALFENGFAGVVMLADWIGSSTGFFPFSAYHGEDRMNFARGAAKTFVADSWLAIDQTRRADSADRNAFTRVAAEKLSPNPAQAAMLTLPVDDPSSITILECETGSGKTEAALARFAALFSAGAVDGLYFALPTRTAATEMHSRVYKAVQGGFRVPPPVVLAVPGYLRVDEAEATKLPHFKVLWPDQDRFRYRAWAGELPKRYLAGCVVVGTIDQVLLSSLQTSHAHLRATSLLRQLLVVDEVHASDAYMTRILEEVLGRHVRAGGHALLLSATLGGEARLRLLDPGKPVNVPPLAEAAQAPYPLISHAGRARFELTPNAAQIRKHIKLGIEPWLETPEETAVSALKAARAGAKVLVIKNTVADCIETQEALEQSAAANGDMQLLFTCARVKAPHHARFARVDRQALDGALERQFGKQREQGGCVVVATQTVQQSLDIDADYLITDLCPMDVLLQRLGRLHRHERTRPVGFEATTALVVVPANRDLGVLLGREGRPRHHHGLGTVYPDLRVLEATWSLIEERPALDIPALSRKLVERSLHRDALAAVVAEKCAAWDLHAQRMLGINYGEQRQAHLNLSDWTERYSETTFPDDVRIPTRLGEGDRRVIFDLPFIGPFGEPVKELAIRATWAAGIASDVYAAEVVDSKHEVTRFDFGGKRFRYDRLGLRKPSHRQEEGDDDGP